MRSFGFRVPENETMNAVSMVKANPNLYFIIKKNVAGAFNLRRFYVTSVLHARERPIFSMKCGREKKDFESETN